jgi:hypothetical protein
MTSIEDRRAHWQAQISVQKASGLSVAAWCTEHDISIHTFRYWSAKFHDSPCGDLNWLSVATEPAAAKTPLQVRVGLATVDVFSGFDPALLRDIVAALQPQC